MKTVAKFSGMIVLTFLCSLICLACFMGPPWASAQAMERPEITDSDTVWVSCGAYEVAFFPHDRPSIEDAQLDAEFYSLSATCQGM